MSGQTARGITYPTSGDQIAPLATHFQNQAETTDDAIDASLLRPARFLQKLGGGTASVQHNTWTVITGWEPYLNDGADAAISYGNGAITINQPGKYELYAQLAFAGQATPAGIRGIRFVRNSVSIGIGGIMGTPSSQTPVSVNVAGRMNSGDVIEIQAYHGGGAGVNLGFQTAGGYNILHVAQIDPSTA
jgi:hypothetical protein